jgi:hypothetical protein
VEKGLVVHVEAERNDGPVEDEGPVVRGEIARGDENPWADIPWSGSRGSLRAQSKVSATAVILTVALPCRSVSVVLFQECAVDECR